jgi:hypothetical protein
LGDLDDAFSGSYLDNGEPVEGSEFVSQTFQGNVGMLWSDAIERRAVWRYADSHSETFPDASGGPRQAVSSDVAEQDVQELTLGLTLSHEVSPWWRYHAQFALYNGQEDRISPEIEPGPENPFGVPASETDATFRRYELTLNHTFDLATDIDITIGAQAQFEDGTSTGRLEAIGPTNFDVSRDTWSPFVELQFVPLPGVWVQGGVHVD